MNYNLKYIVFLSILDDRHKKKYFQHCIFVFVKTYRMYFPGIGTRWKIEMFAVPILYHHHHRKTWHKITAQSQFLKETQYFCYNLIIIIIIKLDTKSLHNHNSWKRHSIFNTGQFSLNHKWKAFFLKLCMASWKIQYANLLCIESSSQIRQIRVIAWLLKVLLLSI